MKRTLLLSPDAAVAGAPEVAAPGENMTASMSALEALGEPEHGTKDSPAPEKPAPAKEPAKPAAKDPPKTVPDKALPPKAAPVKDPAKEPAKEPPKEPAKEPDVTAMAPKQLREAYADLKAKHKALVAERDELKAKPPAPADEGERKRLNEELTGARTRLNELENHIRFVDYEKSSEYQERYHKPYMAAAQDAANQVSQLEVTQQDGTVRPATAQDFWAIARMDNAGQALKAANELFGDPAAATYVMQQRENVRRAWMAAENAKEEFRKSGAERMRIAEEQNRNSSQQMAGEWKKMNDAAAGENEWLKPVEGDDEGNELLTKGFETADVTFGGPITDEKGNKRLPTPAERMKIDVEVRNRAAAFPRIQSQLEKAQAKITELEAALKAYEESQPGAGEAEGGDKKDAADELTDVERRLDAMAE